MAQRAQNKLAVVGQANEQAPTIPDTSETSDNLVKGKGTRESVFTRFATTISVDAIQKVQLLQDVKQRLAEAKDTFEQGKDVEVEARQIADKAAVKLYQGRADGNITAEEVSAALGDVFGYKVTKEGKVSKTPEGRGEEIRKRIVRLVNTHDFVTNGDGGKYFEPVDDDATDTLANVLDDVANGGSIWTAYETIADIRKDYLGDRIPMHMNAQAIMKLVDKLASAETDEAGLGVTEAIEADPALTAAYAALGETLTAIFADMGEADEVAEDK